VLCFTTSKAISSSLYSFSWRVAETYTKVAVSPPITVDTAYTGTCVTVTMSIVFASGYASFFALRTPMTGFTSLGASTVGNSTFIVQTICVTS